MLTWVPAGSLPVCSDPSAGAILPTEEKFIFFGLAFSTLAPTTSLSFWHLVLQKGPHHSCFPGPGLHFSPHMFLLTLFCLEYPPSRPHLRVQIPSFSQNWDCPWLPPISLTPAQPDLLGKSGRLCLQNRRCLGTGVSPLSPPLSSAIVSSLTNYNGVFSDLPALDLAYSTAGIYIFQSQSVKARPMNNTRQWIPVALRTKPRDSFPWPLRPPKSGPGHWCALIPLHSLTPVTLLQTSRCSAVTPENRAVSYLPSCPHLCLSQTLQLVGMSQSLLIEWQFSALKVEF